MEIKELSVTFHTDKIADSKEFYKNVLGGKITFDCDWYVVITFSGGMCIAFMKPQSDYPLIGNGQTTINLLVEDVDAEYLRIKESGTDILVDIANQPWGDRSFRIKDPVGNLIYIYTPTEVSDEYKSALKD